MPNSAMTFKLLASLLVTLLAVQASNQSPTVKDDSLKEIVLAVFNGILQVTGGALDKANNLVDTIEEDQVQITADIIAFVVNQGKALNAIFLDLIDDLREGATEDGEAVIDCIAAEQDKTEAAFEEVSAIIGNCAANEITIIVTQFRTILSQLGDLQADVQSQTDTLSACSDNELTCLIAFTETAGTVIEKIPDAVSQDIAEIVELVKTFIEDFSTCDVTSTILSRTQEIFNDGVVCINS